VGWPRVVLLRRDEAGAGPLVLIEVSVHRMAARTLHPDTWSLVSLRLSLRLLLSPACAQDEESSGMRSTLPNVRQQSAPVRASRALRKSLLPMPKGWKPKSPDPTKTTPAVTTG